ncbi:MAG: MFS transporter [Pseudomonadota bacterium]
MAEVSRKGVWGWMLFDWASQPFHTLLITFIFGAYFVNVVAPDPITGQATWGWMLAASGAFIAILAPILGSMADAVGPRKPWIFGFSIFYVLGSAALWFAVPDMPDPIWILIAFGVGLVGVEFATVFTNAMLPDLGPPEKVGALSGNGWAMGYAGGIVSLIIALGFLIGSPETGATLLGFAPLFGLDPAMGEGERATGVLTAVWYVVFMIPLFLFTPDRPRNAVTSALNSGLQDLRGTLKTLPARKSFTSYLISSMFYRDALNGLFAFGGLYATGVLGWSIIQLGVFGIVAAATGVVGAVVGGRLDVSRGPKPVVMGSILILTLICIAVVMTTPTQVMGIPVAEGSSAPTVAFYVFGGILGAMAGSVQAASRTLLVRQSSQGAMTQSFGLYALTGKATAWLAPVSVAAATTVTESQRFGIVPIIVLFLIGGLLLVAVKPEGDDAPT